MNWLNANEPLLGEGKGIYTLRLPRNAVYAAIRVNDATPLLLSPEEKAAGQVELGASPDIKVELIARNWMRDSRGIVRFVKAENVSGRSTIP